MSVPSDLPFGSSADQEVTCIACGEVLERSAAREYDKYGDRWSRDGKALEYLCKPCYRDHCHYPREDLEERLVAAGAGGTDLRTFLASYCDRNSDETAPQDG